MLAAAVCLALHACATAGVPSAETRTRAAALSSYSAALRVSLRGREIRARVSAIVAFHRPDALRVEVPGPAGSRLVAVVRGGELVAVFPGSRAVFRAAATERGFSELFDLALTPEEVMDLLVGRPSPRLRAYDARWGAALPREIAATLPDGARLELRIEDPRVDSALPEAAFLPPPHEGYRLVDAAEARELWR